MRRSAGKRAENEAAFREANEGLARKAAQLGLQDQRTPYLCECEVETCIELLRLSRDEYEAVRADPKAFVVTPGHYQADYDEVVQEQDGYTVIQKTGEEGKLVEELDPRAESV
jgi:hypothetical protein